MRRMAFVVSVVSGHAVHWSVHRERCRSAGSSGHRQRHGGRDYLVAAERHGDHRRDRAVELRGGDLAPQRPRDEPELGSATRLSDRDRPGAGRPHVQRAGRLHVRLRRPPDDDDRHGHRRGRGRRPARERARVLGDGRVPPRLDRRGHRRDPGARGSQRLRGHRDRGLDAVQHRQPRPVRRRRLPLHDRRRPLRHRAGRIRGLHARRRRLRRHPCRGRYGVHVALVRPDGRRLFPQPPARHPHGDGQHRGS